MLRNGLAAAGATAAGAVLLDGKPAAAASGNALIMGIANHATEPTLLSVDGTGPSYAYGLGVADNGYAQALTARPALFAYAKGSYFDTGLQVLADAGQGVQVDVKGAGKGIVVQTQVGRGLDVQSSGYQTIFVANSASDGIAVYATSAGVNKAVVAIGDQGGGVVGISANGAGVEGMSTDGIGVFASCNHGLGVEGVTDTGVGVLARSVGTGPALQAITTSGAGFVLTAGTGTGADLTAQKFQLRLAPTSARKAPSTDSFAHKVGELVEDSNGDLWSCVAAGTPGRWRKMSGPKTAGAFHVLPAPKRIYDSRPGTTPSVGPKTPLSGNTPRTLDVTVNSSGVPTDATAVSLTVLLVNAANAAGNLTVWADTVARPASNTMVWGGSAGRFTALAITALTAGKLQIAASNKTDVVLDIVGYYR